jgi:hypothetical protein
VTDRPRQERILAQFSQDAAWRLGAILSGTEKRLTPAPVEIGFYDWRSSGVDAVVV